jgi:hypothetical protein
MTKAQMIHRDNCRLCSSGDLEIVVKLQPIPLAEKYSSPGQAASASDDVYPVDLYMCRTCGHVQILDVVDSEKLWDDYTYHSGQTKGIVDHFQTVAQNLVARQHPPAGSLVIDVGSNDGSLLRPFKELGFRVLGIDPAREIARKATESGIPTIASLLTMDLAKRIRSEHGPASVITAFNVFAHADDMNGMAASIRHMLADDGVFQFEAQYLLDILDKMLLGTIFHEHMSHHSLKPMKQFLQRHDMELIDVERVTIQMGSIIGTAQPKSGPRKITSAVGELLALEDQRQLDKPATVRQFADKLQQIRDKVQTLLAGWRKNGSKVAGYGAARSGPTLITQFGLDGAIQVIFDDHPQKVGKLSPGHRIPVVPTQELCTRMPDYVVILAFLHAKKIIAGSQEYLDRGGKFVVCCPDVQIISKDGVVNV